MNLGIAGRKAIVCASSRGLGRACAEALAREGVGVTLNGRDGAALADACARAAAVDPRPLWPNGIRAAAAWFDGDNDLRLPMWDPETGGGFDGLHADRVNLNQGAESTLAALSTMQQARRFAPARR